MVAENLRLRCSSGVRGRSSLPLPPWPPPGALGRNCLTFCGSKPSKAAISTRIPAPIPPPMASFPRLRPRRSSRFSLSSPFSQSMTHDLHFVPQRYLTREHFRPQPGGVRGAVSIPPPLIGGSSPPGAVLCSHSCNFQRLGRSVFLSPPPGRREPENRNSER